MNNHIPCSEYDYFEIACTFHLAVELTLLDGTTVKGTASSLHIEKDQNGAKEVLSLTQPDQKINLTDVKRMKALTNNPHFNSVDIHSPYSGK